MLFHILVLSYVEICDHIWVADYESWFWADEDSNDWWYFARKLFFHQHVKW
jgi:hypothetical protein